MSCTCTYVKAGQRFKKCACGRTLVMFTWYIVESPLKLTRVLDLHLILQGRYFDQTQGGKHLNSWCHLTTYAQSIASDGWWESSAAVLQNGSLLLTTICWRDVASSLRPHIPASNSYHTNTDVAAESDYDHSAQRCSWQSMTVRLAMIVYVQEGMGGRRVTCSALHGSMVVYQALATSCCQSGNS